MDTKVKTVITTTTTSSTKEYNAADTKKALCDNVKKAAIGTSVATCAVVARNVASGYALGCAYNGRNKASTRAMKVAAIADGVAVGATIATAIHASFAAYEAATMYENLEIEV